jgi:hypothetical protein
MRYLGVLLATLTLSGCGLPLGAAAWVESKLYSGDGHISTCPTLFAAGYRIEFQPFSPAHPYHAVYRLAHVPQVGRAPRLALRFRSDMLPSSMDDLKKRVSSVVRVRISDSHGRVQSVDLSPSGAGWGHESPDFFGVFQPDSSGLHLERSENYLVNLSYTPGAVPLPVGEVYLEVEDCAFY